jgi:hypothetical protein
MWISYRDNPAIPSASSTIRFYQPGICNRRNCARQPTRELASRTKARLPDVFLQEDVNRDVQHARDMSQAAAGNAVRRGFVLLDLLIGNAEPLTERGLRQPKPHPMETDVAAYLLVQRIRGLFDTHRHRARRIDEF